MSGINQLRRDMTQPVPGAAPQLATPMARNGPLDSNAGAWAEAIPRLVVVAAGIGAAVLLAPILGISIPPLLLLGAAVGAGVWAAAAVRELRREQLARSIEQSLETELGANRVTLRGGWWRRPGRIKVAYTARVGVRDLEAQFMATALTVAIARTGTGYVGKAHDPHKCRIVLRRQKAHEEAQDQEEAEQHLVLARAERTANQLLRNTAKVVETRLASDGTLTRLCIEHDMGTMVTTPAQQARIETTMGKMLPGRWRIHWDHENDRFTLETVPMLSTSIAHPRLEVSDRWRIPFGKDVDGNTVYWVLRGPGSSPHLLVIGKTGTGKTVCLIGLIAELTARGFAVWLGDPKRIEFLGMSNWPNVQILATTVEAQVAMIHRAHQVMEDRYALIEAGVADESSFEPLIMVLDEYRDFLGALRPWYASVKGGRGSGAPSVPPVIEKLGSIIRKGRTAGVHVIMGTQRPDADQLGGEMRDNFHARISLGALSPQGAQMCWEAPHIGVAVPLIKGRGTAVGIKGDPVEMQAFWTPDPHPRKLRTGSDDEALLTSLRPAPQNVKWDRLAYEPPDRDDLRDSASHYWAYAEAQFIDIEDAPEAEADVDVISTMRARLPKGMRQLVTGTSGDDAIQPAPVAAGEPQFRIDDAPAAGAELETVGSFEDDLEDRYAPPTETPLSTLEDTAGGLILLDENEADPDEAWVIVEGIEPDPMDPDNLMLSWRHMRTGESDCVSLDAAGYVTYREPLEETALETSWD